MGKSRLVLFPKAQRAKLQALSPHRPFNESSREAVNNILRVTDWIRQGIERKFRQGKVIEKKVLVDEKKGQS